MAEKRKMEDGAPVTDYRPGKKVKQARGKPGIVHDYRPGQKAKTASGKPSTGVPDYRPRSKSKQQDSDHGRAPKKGFSVGPANLPDGTYRRKAQEIKGSLIQRAKIKKDYAKVQKSDNVSGKVESIPQPQSLRLEQENTIKQVQENRDDKPKETVFEAEEPKADPHPDRQIQIDQEVLDPTKAPEPVQPSSETQRQDRRPRRPKPVPFKREHDEAQQRKAEADARRAAREKAEQQRAAKIEERERFRRAMAKARSGGVNGQRKLGRESQVLLERVRRLVE
ncbi:hypothetical protein LTR62_004354 [Meristemomyces frigidus]|uniref:rRNA-processing protein FYV7 n=1 Tax=Meristemomyces frigidus TaxID=1508187 RepID=A0AAN7TR11_9PEZI|nr:hypothetical protein LTR62_004354 [Meristemomyces frigidus]